MNEPPSCSSIAQQLGERAVLGRYIRFQPRSLAEFVTRLGKLAKSVERERGIQAYSRVGGVELLRGAVGVERALEVAAAEVQVAAIVERRGVARVELENGVELALRDVEDPVARVEGADLQPGVDVLRIGGESLPV